MWSPIPRRIARRYLEDDLTVTLLLAFNGAGILAGLRFYHGQMAEVPTLAWPLLLDSPLAMALFVASVLTLTTIPTVDRYPTTTFLTVLNTLAFASALKYGLWTAAVVNLFFGAYYPALWSYFVIALAHAVMVLEAFLIPHYARTSRVALAATAVWLLANDVADYGFGIYPHLRVDEVGPLPALTVGLSVLSVAAAWYCMDLQSSR